jgi:hypothetical protein
MSFGLQFGSLGTSLSVSRSVSTSTSTTESLSETVTRNHSATVSVGPRKWGKIDLLAYETTIEIPFSATIVIDGSLVPNRAGLTGASQLLSVRERTLPFRGTLRITNVSNGVTRTTDIPGKPNCEAASADSLEKTSKSTTFPADSLSGQELTTFTRPSTQPPLSLTLKAIGADAKVVTPLAADGPEIGPADGIVYQILYTTETVKPTPLCGYNDIGFPNNARYSVEAREYTMYSKGLIISRWQESVEVFKSCEA